MWVLTPLKFFGQKKVRWALELKSITECWEESRWWRSLCGDKSFFFLHGVEPLPSSPSLPSFMSLHSLHKSFNLFGGKNNQVGLNLPQKETVSPYWWGKDYKCFKSRNRTTMIQCTAVRQMCFLIFFILAFRHLFWALLLKNLYKSRQTIARRLLLQQKENDN